MDFTQKWSDLEGCIKKSVMTEEEEKKQKERKAHQLRIIVERADTALEGNKRLLEKRRGEMEIWESSDKNWSLYLRDRKNTLKGSKLEKPITREKSSST